ncbi:FT-interacting protein 1 [Selaginella moellendorffii]|uniref:FT-interacting protein 1 n=1 Tax=Selaginella moellendorffii TaxID=88036 RepID=UPI000D1C590C|nr:FT-interacting protein 1 [Selaginella moellendorffii]|eukprot:XP_024531162.1 FT-interacting protein 1 [Selaginella moellendorffii]
MGRKLFVEVCNAADLMPKDGQGSASAYCTLEFDGQRRKTDTKAKDLNPVWNTVVEFPILEGKNLESEVLELSVLCEKRGAQRKPGFLGKVKIPGRSIVKKGEEALVYYPLEKRSMFSQVKGEIGLKVWWSDDPDPSPPAPASPSAAAAASGGGTPPAEEVTAKDAAVPEVTEEAPAAPAAAAAAAAAAEHHPAPSEPAEAPVEQVREIQLEEMAEPKEEKHEETEERREDAREEVPMERKEEQEEMREIPNESKEEKHEKEEEKREEARDEKKEEEKKKKEEKHEEKNEQKHEPKQYEEKKKEEKKENKKEDKEEKKPEETREYRSVGRREEQKDVKDQKIKERKGDAPTIVIKRHDDEHEHELSRKLVRSSTVPSTDFHLKETTPALARGIGERVVTYDLVEKMNYLFVKVVKARALMESGSGSSYARIVFGSLTAKTKEVGKSLFPEWHEIFAFSKDNSAGPVVEVSIWDHETDQFMGAVGFDLQEIPFRVPPDSPLAPQWYRLENISKNAEKKVRGDVMLAIWWGTQADEAFTEAWQSDSGGYAHTRAKVYLSPKLWYLRVNVIEAQEVQPMDRTRFPEVSVRAQLGFQIYKTKVASNRNTSPQWNEDLLFVASEPFEDELLLVVQNKTAKPNEEEVLGMVKIALAGIEKRIDHRQVNSKWFDLVRYNGGDKHFHGRLHLRLCFDGGYHVMDEATHYSSCVRPTAKQLWRPVVGVLELGIIRGKDVHPMKTVDGRGATDAYCVAKYGQKWVRTRTIVDNLNPRWNEQYSWEVYDPCTVLTVGVFDNCHVHPHPEGGKDLKDLQIGKVRIRLSTLESERIYTNSHPLLMLQRSGVRKLGEIELAVRYSSVSIVSVMGLYFRPLLPKMHYLHPLGVTQSEILRISAMRLVAIRLNRSEPPLRQEVVQFMLDADFHVWSLRRSKVNYFRIMNLLAGPMAVGTWFHNICHWKNPVTTLLVHILFLILVMFPELILPTLFLYLSLIGAWRYRYRPRSPPSMDGKLSQAEQVEPDELDEEFDPIPTNKDPSVVKARYDRLRIVSSRIQHVLGDIATQGERLTALLSWRDPRASGIMVAVCMTIAIFLYVVPLRVIVVIVGLYVLRHPKFRERLPGWPINFFRRLPSLADRIL